MSRSMQEKKLGAGRVVAVAIENNKSSQHAAKWAVENLIPKDQCLNLIHVIQRTPTPGVDVNENADAIAECKELFDSFKVFCNRKNIQCREILLEGMDVSRTLTEGVAEHSIELLVLGAASKGGIVRRFRTSDIPSAVSKGAPQFCTVYIIAKGKISSVRSATSPLVSKSAVPTAASMRSQLQTPTPPPKCPEKMDQPVHARNYPPRPSSDFHKPPFGTGNRLSLDDDDDMISPFSRAGNKYESSGHQDSDISFVSNGRPSVDRMFPSMYDDLDAGIGCRMSNDSDLSNRSSFSGPKSIDLSSSNYDHDTFSFTSSQSSGMGSQRLSDPNDDVEAEMRRLKLELKQTMDLYSSACKEALTAKQKAMELQRWKLEEQKKSEEARTSEEAAMTLVEIEQEKSRVALMAAEASKKIALLEAQKRMSAASEGQRMKSESGYSQARYRRYTIDEIEEATNNFSASLKIGEGGYGPVYRCELDHTQVAIKVLKPDAAQGREQFQQEVEVLSCIRHPNMVLLLGACPEYGCLVYEYMANGSLDDCLFPKGKVPPLPWQLRFQIAAEIATGLLFLHQAKPEPLVHRDLKPGNILLDRNFVSKIGDVGLARLVPPTVADTVTQYRMTSTAGTFCYIDPEYQQTGMLGIKSDIYSLGIMLLQMVTAKPPMGLTHHVGKSIERGTFAEMLDPAIEDWPVDHALHFAKIALQCAEMRRKDRPDLGKVILPELNKLRQFAEESMPSPMMMFRTGFKPRNYNSSSCQDFTSDSKSSGNSGCESRSSTSSSQGRL